MFRSYSAGDTYPKGGMPPLVVVEDFYVLHDCRTRLRPGGEASVMHQFLPQGGKEALPGGVAPTVGPAAHAAGDAVPGQQPLVVVT